MAFLVALRLAEGHGQRSAALIRISNRSAIDGGWWRDEDVSTCNDLGGITHSLTRAQFTLTRLTGRPYSKKDAVAAMPLALKQKARLGRPLTFGTSSARIHQIGLNSNLPKEWDHGIRGCLRSNLRPKTSRPFRPIWLASKGILSNVDAEWTLKLQMLVFTQGSYLFGEVRLSLTTPDAVCATVHAPHVLDGRLRTFRLNFQGGHASARVIERASSSSGSQSMPAR